MTSTPIMRRLVALLIAFASLFALSRQASDFASTRPAARVEYWRQHQSAIQAQVADATRLRAVKRVFVGDSIADLWLLGDDPWIPGRMHGRQVRSESFGGAVPQDLALNIGISVDGIEHLLFRFLPESQGGLGQLDAEALALESFVLMVGIDDSHAPEMPVADSVFEGTLAAMRSLHARKPGTRLLLQSILPRSEPSRGDTVVKPVNVRLAALAKRAEFAGFTNRLDLYPSFVEAQGRQDARLFVDGLHPSEAGCRLWRDRLVSALATARTLAR